MLSTMTISMIPPRPPPPFAFRTKPLGGAECASKGGAQRLQQGPGASVGNVTLAAMRLSARDGHYGQSWAPSREIAVDLSALGQDRHRGSGADGGSSRVPVAASGWPDPV